jgi:predicted nucleotidyltransferase component of viral defense system
MKPSEELIRVYPEAESYFEPVSLLAYDPKEILCEKVRAILTRRGIKARDFLDVYLLKEKMGLDVANELECASMKIEFMLEHYKRYRKNLEAKKQLLETESLFEWGNERDLLLIKINEPSSITTLNESKEP